MTLLFSKLFLNYMYFLRFLKRARKTEDEETGNDRFPVNLYHVEGQGTAEVNASSADEQWKIGKFKKS